MNSSPFMDKQIMGLSGSPVGLGGVSTAGGGELFDLMNPQEDRRDNGGVLKREEIVPSYDFQPIRPVTSLPSSSGDDASRHSRFSSGGLFGEPTLGPDISLAHRYGASVDDVEVTVKKYAEIILHTLEGMGSRLSQLESRTCILENSVDDLKVSIGNNYGSADGKLRQLEIILREVQTGVQVLRDKQEIAEAHLELAKLQLSSKADHPISESLQALPELQQKQQYQQPPPQQAPQSSTIALPAPNAPPSPLPQQSQPTISYAPQVPLQLPQMPPSVIPPPPQDQPSYPKPSHQSSQYPLSLGHSNESSLQQPQQYQVPHPQLYQPPPQIPQYSQPIQPEDPLSAYMPPPSQGYPPNIRQPSPPQPPAGPPIHQYYGTTNPPPQLYDLPPASRPSFSGPGLGFSEPYLYGNSPSQFSSKPPPLTSGGSGSGSGSYQRLPTAKILPQAAPAGGSDPSGNRVPVDDVVEKVATMGFSREQVRATVRKLTENGQSVDLNVVLDKLMNDGQVHQPVKGWFGR